MELSPALWINSGYNLECGGRLWVFETDLWQKKMKNRFPSSKPWRNWKKLFPRLLQERLAWKKVSPFMKKEWNWFGAAGPFWTGRKSVLKCFRSLTVR